VSSANLLREHSIPSSRSFNKDVKPGLTMHVKPQTNTSPKSAFFLFCRFDTIQNSKQARNKYLAGLAKAGDPAGTTHKPLRKGGPATPAEHQQKT